MKCSNVRNSFDLKSWTIKSLPVRIPSSRCKRHRSFWSFLFKKTANFSNCFSKKKNYIESFNLYQVGFLFKYQITKMATIGSFLSPRYPHSDFYIHISPFFSFLSDSWVVRPVPNWNFNTSYIVDFEIKHNQLTLHY